jgi:thymidylate synthase
MKKNFECTSGIASETRKVKPGANPQKILVFQQNNSGEKKIEGIRQFGDNRFTVEVVSINETLPEIIDDTTKYIPRNFQADLVLDYLNHPDLSHDLAALCRDKKIPVVASGKKLRVEGVLTPPT